LNLGENYKKYLQEQNLTKIANPTLILSEKLNSENIQYEYMGVFLTVASKKKLLQNFPALFASVYADHIVLAYNPTQNDMLNFVIGEYVDFVIVDYFFDKVCQAFVVELSDKDKDKTKFSQRYVLPLSMTRKTHENFCLELISKLEHKKKFENKNYVFTGVTGSMIAYDKKNYIMM
jgi:hypothetical protein